jgi:hypothetical protein
MPPSNVMIRDPLDHYDVLETDPCGCAVCSSWRRAKQDYTAAAKNRPDHLPTCGCDTCTPIRRMHFQYQAFNVRRDLWIESSYHASIHKYGPTYMSWLAVRTVDAKRRSNWWAIEASRFSVDYWFAEFDSAIRSGVVSVTGANPKTFEFMSYYLDVEPEGGGMGSLSSLFVDDVYCASESRADQTLTIMDVRHTVAV